MMKHFGGLQEEEDSVQMSDDLSKSNSSRHVDQSMVEESKECEVQVQTELMHVCHKHSQ